MPSRRLTFNWTLNLKPDPSPCSSTLGVSDPKSRFPSFSQTHLSPVAVPTGAALSIDIESVPLLLPSLVWVAVICPWTVVTRPPPLHPHLFSAEQPERPCETKVSPSPLHSPPTQGSHPVRNKSHILSTGLARPPDCGSAFISHLFSCSSHSSQAGLRAGPRASRHGPASGPLHLLFLWPRMLFP